MAHIERALISVSNKQDVERLAAELHAHGIEIVSTGGTATTIRESGIPVIPVEKVTGFPEMMDGRLKTLHPLIHGALLGRRNNLEDIAACMERGIVPIQMVVVNLYPFQQKVDEGAPIDVIIENIDIGGPAMMRAGAKSPWVTVVPGPEYYDVVLNALHDDNNACVIETARNFNYAALALNLTHQYDAAISRWMMEMFEHHMDDLAPYFDQIDSSTNTVAAQVKATSGDSLDKYLDFLKGTGQ